MPLMTWDPSFSVQVKRCDNHHQKLFYLVNTLHEAMAEGKGADVVQHVVQELLEYAKYHFSAEEALMEQAGYIGLEVHRLRHQEFVKQVEQFQKELEISKTGKAIEVLAFIKQWLATHIKQTDKRYSAHLNSKGIL